MEEWFGHFNENKVSIRSDSQNAAAVLEAGPLIRLILLFSSQSCRINTLEILCYLGRNNMSQFLLKLLYPNNTT